MIGHQFSSVQRRFYSSIYGYANANILFSKKLIRTLYKVLRSQFYQHKLLTVGKRLNLNLDQHKIKLNGKLNCELFPDLVIGRPMVDNYLMYFLRAHNVTEIDATSGVTALHQITNQRKHGVYQVNDTCNGLILKILFSLSDIKKGMIECAPYVTQLNAKGDIYILKMDKFTLNCE